MTEEATAPRRNWLRRVYDWIIGHSKGKYAWETLGAVSFLESSILPIPPDVILIPMVLADRRRWLMLTLWCTVTSVAGGLVGYYIGNQLQPVAHWLLDVYGSGDDFAKFQKLYAEYGDWIIILKGLTPIPYKIVTIASGLSNYDLWSFIWLSFLTRFARFGLVAALLHWKGEPIRNFIEKNLGLTLLGLVAVIVLGLVLARYIV